MPSALPQAQLARRELAAHYLRMLLAERGRYRAYWARRADKVPPGEISQAAVARVIAEYLQRQDSIEDDLTYRPLKDRVYRALSGKSLTPSTLSLFAEAFSFTQEDARQIWSLLLGTTPEDANDAISSMDLPPSNAAAFQPSQFRVVSLNEIHQIGPDGLSQKHHVRQRIEATADGLSRMPVRFDSGAVAVEVPHGGKTDIYRCTDGLYAVDILLPAVLRSGEKTDIEYTIVYEAPRKNDRQFKRSALRRPIGEATIEVRFSVQRPPKTVWWAIWQDLDEAANPAVLERVALDPKEPSVRKEVSAVEGAAVGFRWEWW